MQKTVRMSDIAGRLGVSTVTVSKALNGKAGVSGEVRKKIMEMACQMGYPAAISQKSAQSGDTTGNIGIISSSRFFAMGNNSFYWEMYRHLLTHLRGSKYYGILEVLTDEDESGLIPPRLLQDAKTDGIILLGQFDERYLELLYKSDIPLMFLDSYNGKSGRSSIISDGYYGMYAVVSYLINMGHRDIYFLGQPGATSSISDRYFGYCRAMSEYGLPVMEHMVIPDRDENGKMCITLPEKLPTAFACNCDLAAYQLLGLLKERGLSVPDDISVAGFDDYIHLPNNQSFPRITTYAVDIGGMAQLCVEAILKKIKDNDYRPTLKVVTGHLVIKDTVIPL